MPTGFICHDVKGTKQIFNCGATDTMSFNSSDFLRCNTINKTHIQTANGERVNVEGSGLISITDNIQMSNCLFVPNLKN